MVLYTEDFAENGFKANEYAKLIQFDDIDDIKKYIIENGKSLNCHEQEVCGLRKVHFDGGAWINSYRELDNEEKEILTEEVGELRICGPGCLAEEDWFINPVNPVFIPVFKVLDEGEWVHPEGDYIKLD